jgi:hypothetical protein
VRAKLKFRIGVLDGGVLTMKALPLANLVRHGSANFQQC